MLKLDCTLQLGYGSSRKSNPHGLDFGRTGGRGASKVSMQKSGATESHELLEGRRALSHGPSQAPRSRVIAELPR